LLTLVPWLLHRQGVDIGAAAAEFGVTTEQMEADLALLFLCGTPGGMPDDLIEADWEEGRVYLGNADPIARPLRLGVDEALTLIVGLRTLAAIPGLGDRDVIDRALAKLEEATSGLREPGTSSATPSEVADKIRVDIGDDASTGHLTSIRDALARHRRLHLSYFVPSRDETTERDVDPMRLTTMDGHWYLEGWCHRSSDIRLFRLDRIQGLEVLDVDGTPPRDARPRDLDQGVFQPREDDTVVRLRLSPQAMWVADYYPHDDLRLDPAGGADVTLRTADVTWVRRLAWQLGGAAEVLEPLSLRASVARGADDALAAYRPS
jgi:proteasome accessory factor C